VDLSGFAPFFAPLMFYLNGNLWPTMTLIVSLVAALLMAYIISLGAEARSARVE
jgi:hypothetical protein